MVLLNNFFFLPGAWGSWREEGMAREENVFLASSGRDFWLLAFDIVY